MSQENISSMIYSKEIKQKILKEFLPLCELDGWNEEVLKTAMRNCEIDENLKDIIFENGCLDLAFFYVSEQNEKAKELCFQGGNFLEEKIRNKIRYFLYARFEVEKAHKIALHRLVNFYTNPKNLIFLEIGMKPAFFGIKSFYEVADFIWLSINDQSTDFNFYTKRLSLSRILMKGLFIFLKDDSENLSKTKKFIDDEIEKIMKFEKCKSKVKSFVNFSNQGLKEFFMEENGQLKSPKKLIKSLPFIRLFK